jgi:hypothetical protein
VTDLLQFLEVAAHPALAPTRNPVARHVIGGLPAADLSQRQAPALLRALSDVGEDELAAVLANRVVGEVDLDRAGTCARWAKTMRDIGEHDAADALSARAANAGHFDLYLKINPDQGQTFAFGREVNQGQTPPWGWHDLE